MCEGVCECVFVSVCVCLYVTDSQREREKQRTKRTIRAEKGLDGNNTSVSLSHLTSFEPWVNKFTKFFLKETAIPHMQQPTLHLNVARALKQLSK